MRAVRICRLLIANRGEIARRIIRTADAMGIETVAVYSDADAQALHVREATAAHALGGNASTDSYLRIDKLIGAARATGADAVHPGYGFLSENADFAQAVLDAQLVWVGPPPQAMRELGNKAAVKQLAQRRGVPCLPGYHGADQSDARFATEAVRIGFPLMVKAAAGGGGRGIRLVTSNGQLAAALRSARSEAQVAFGSDELLLERALLQPRHVEVQVFSDAYGNCIHLGERDCSVQRRHQKLIEESPGPAVDDALRTRMVHCAIGLAKAARYVGAGTVEFLLEGGEFYLMEMNTRLQVEHPVTEAVTGLDLVEWQLRVAQGEPLPLTQDQVRFCGHAIEVRLCAEDDEFVPHTGTVREFVLPASGQGMHGGLRLDHAISEGMDVSAHYDSLLGKLIAHAPTRAQAIDRLIAALGQLQLLGLPTNRAFLAACLDHETFRAGQGLIPFLEQQGSAIRSTFCQRQGQLAIQAALAALYPLSPGAIGSGLPCPFARPLRIRHRSELIELRVRETADGMFEVSHGDELRRIARPHAACVRVDTHRWHVQSGAVDLFVDDASFEPPLSAGDADAAMQLRAPFSGKVVAINASPGSAVEKGETLLVIESMKLEHALAASRAGVIQSVHVEAGQQTATGQLLVTMEARE